MSGPEEKLSGSRNKERRREWNCVRASSPIIFSLRQSRKSQVRTTNVRSKNRYSPVTKLPDIVAVEGEIAERRGLFCGILRQSRSETHVAALPQRKTVWNIFWYNSNAF